MSFVLRQFWKYVCTLMNEHNFTFKAEINRKFKRNLKHPKVNLTLMMPNLVAQIN